MFIENQLEYEGEFLFERKYNGKGYDKNGNIIYELINGNGKVKEYYDVGILKFEGEYLNGKRHGKGKEYYENGILLFEGEYLMEKEMEKVKNIIKIMVNYCLKVNIYMVINLKVNII